MDCVPRRETERLSSGLKVRFWGVRGSISCSGAEYVRYGGNTSCLEVTAGGRRLIFDAGTGIRSLGLELARQVPLALDIYFTHTHLDHLNGLLTHDGREAFANLARIVIAQRSMKPRALARSASVGRAARSSSEWVIIMCATLRPR